MSLLTLAQAAKRVQRRRSTILRWVRQGRLGNVRIGAGQVMMLRESELLDAERLIVQRIRGAGVRSGDVGRDASADVGAGRPAARGGSRELLSEAAEQLALVIQHIDDELVELPRDGTEALADTRLVLLRLAEAVKSAR